MILRLHTSTALLAAALWAGCSDPEQTQSKRSSASTADSEATGGDTVDPTDGTDAPVWVNGAYLTMACVAVSTDQNVGRHVFGCSLKDQGGVRVDPRTVSERYKWTAETVSGPVDAAAVETVGGADYDVTFTLGATAYVGPSVLEAVSLTFGWLDPTNALPKKLSVRVANVLLELASLREFRLVFDSIRNHDPTETVQTLTKLELKVDAQWLELTFSLQDGSVALGGRPVKTNGDIRDASHLPNVFGLLVPMLSAPDFPRYAATPPHDAVSEPLYLEFGFDEPRSVTCFRYNGGQAITNRNLPSGFPDVFHLENKKQGVWTTIKGSLLDVDAEPDAQYLEYYWTGSDF